ncbi:Putative forkhead-associated (FHA) domain-containing protein [Septoria linicola]|uniref:Forkhead-associated (FHA) domain-containing protein n=1 Tax=Septoria linicola TaxID=215465 RepID=A0A9Q9AP39_9PEZI|nr:putative forkhead-associated (FHA) domain-containing protein [Septoria linicola]USW49975.1 Putative forkhead-associated (FHA) domain-containing protein [Septoria linicola]
MDATPGAQQQAVPSKEKNETQQARPSLLPAFEPFSPISSSPGLPRAAKRKFDETLDTRQQHYPTPVPTSSTGIITSSSPARQTRPALQRTVSALSERAPLGDVPCLQLTRNGEPLLMGRSSNSSDYQFPANRHISRTHVSATYHAPGEAYPRGRVEVLCLGWNGAKVHCRGEVKELAKHEVFVSDKAGAQIMVDVQNTRVMLAWPKEGSRDPESVQARSPWAQDSPTLPRLGSSHLPSSPPMMLPSPRRSSPVSPIPNLNLGATFAETFRIDADEPVQIYQDNDSEEDAPHDAEATPEPTAPVCEAAGTPTPKRTVSAPKELQSFVSEHEEFSEHDEENDPVVHSFGPFGENLLDKLDSFHAQSPERKRKPLKPSTKSPGRCSSAPFNHSPVKNHVINQLAYSRIHALPLSTIHSQLPPEYRGAMAKPSDREARDILSTSDLKTILDGIPCVGEISREGKDAAGKLLESEFYYVPEMDTDVHRRDAVANSLGKTSIRAARKQHKQYYWKRPRF